MSEREFNSMMERLNNSIYSEYPCPGCQLFAYFCCMCTLGLSCVVPLMQVKSAMVRVNTEVTKVNALLFPRKMKLEHKVENSTSYFIFYLPNHKMWLNVD